MSVDLKHIGFLLETILEQNKAVIDAVAQMQDQIKLLATKADLRKLEIKLDAIQATVTANHKDHLRLEKRVSRLEARTV